MQTQNDLRGVHRDREGAPTGELRPGGRAYFSVIWVGGTSLSRYGVHRDREGAPTGGAAAESPPLEKTFLRSVGPKTPLLTMDNAGDRPPRYGNIETRGLSYPADIDL